MVQELPPPMGFEPPGEQHAARPVRPAPNDSPIAAGMTPLIGERYALLEQIGEGGAARVFRAHDRVLDRIVAVKLLRAEHGHDQDFVARFFREARAVASLAHPNIVDIYDYGTDRSGNYIVMQYIEGTDLKALLQREGRLAPARAVAIASGALRGLGAAHERGLIHRDVKPQNLLVRAGDGLVKLTDFGVARALGGPQHTAEGLTFGTAHYMAPEQATGAEIGPAADLYSVGVVLYEALSGRLPYDGETALAITAQHVHAPLPSLAVLVPDVPAALARVVERALAKDPAARYPSAEALRRALTAAVGDYRVGATVRATPKAAAAQTVALPVADKPTAALPARADAANDRSRPAFRGGYGCLLSLLGALVIGLTVGLFALTRGISDGGDPASTPLAGGDPGSSGVGVALSEPTPTRAVSTATTTPSMAVAPPATATTAPEPTVPAAPPTATPAPPTATAVPPTPTAVPPTATAVPPTPTPVPPAATATSPPPPVPTRPPQAVQPQEPFSPYQLAGAYRRDDGVLYGLPVVALYGQGSGFNEGTANFNLQGRPTGQVRLVLTGLDDERSEHCRLEVIINGRAIFDGATTFPNTPTTDNGVGGQPRYWGQMAIVVPADLLREGRNTITLRNRTAGSRPGIPYILIHNLEFAAP